MTWDDVGWAGRGASGDRKLLGFAVEDRLTPRNEGQDRNMDAGRGSLTTRDRGRRGTHHPARPKAARHVESAEKIRGRSPKRKRAGECFASPQVFWIPSRAR